MKLLELMCSLDEAYHRFGDIEIKIHEVHQCRNHVIEDNPFAFNSSRPNKVESTGYEYGILTSVLDIKELIIESEEFIIKCE